MMQNKISTAQPQRDWSRLSVNTYDKYNEKKGARNSQMQFREGPHKAQHTPNYSVWNNSLRSTWRKPYSRHTCSCQGQQTTEKHKTKGKTKGDMVLGQWMLRTHDWDKSNLEDFRKEQGPLSDVGLFWNYFVLLLHYASDGDCEEEEGDMDIDDARKATEVAYASAAAEVLGMDSADVADALAELKMDNYDDEDDGIELLSRLHGDSYYASNDMDPYLKDNDDNDSEEEEDMTIKANDGVIVCARNDDDVSQLEIYILEETEDGAPNLYVHHYIIFSAFPLCTAWLNCSIKGGEKGNFIAVGSMEPAIEIWDLDVIDEVQPCLILGGISKREKEGKKTRIKYKEGSHRDSVLGLAWNKEFRNILASASADKLVKIWDVSSGKCDITMEHHTDKVQAVAWNPDAPEVLLSGSFDHTVVMRDVRKPSHSGYKWSIPADVESLAWDPHTESSFIVSLENGTVQGFDIRAASSNSGSESKPVFTLHAHDEAVCSISYSP
ncbi:Periodic tryptophan protein 1-like protein, partial [Drosera capensis]